MIKCPKCGASRFSLLHETTWHYGDSLMTTHHCLECGHAWSEEVETVAAPRKSMYATIREQLRCTGDVRKALDDLLIVLDEEE